MLKVATLGDMAWILNELISERLLVRDISSEFAIRCHQDFIADNSTLI